MRPHSKREISRGSRLLISLAGAVAGEHDLVAAVEQGVEGVEELLLRALLAGEELDVVDEQHVRAAVAAAEFLDVAAADRVDELVGELLAGQIDHPRARLAAEQLVADGLHEVGLAETRAAVDEERIVTDAGFLRDRLAGGVGELAVIADDEAGEGVGRIEAGALDALVERLAFERRRLGRAWRGG